MIRGLYASATGIDAANLVQNFIAENLANAQQTGYLRRGVTFQSFQQAFENAASSNLPRPIDNGPPPNPEDDEVNMLLGTQVARGYTVFTPGALQFTGNPVLPGSLAPFVPLARREKMFWPGIFQPEGILRDDSSPVHQFDRDGGDAVPGARFRLRFRRPNPHPTRSRRFHRQRRGPGHGYLYRLPERYPANQGRRHGLGGQYPGAAHGNSRRLTQSDTDLRVQDGQGRVVYLNTTAITPGFDGTIDLTADGTLSLDGGATNLPIDFNAANQTVVDSRTGLATHINPTGIRQTGDDRLTYPGTFDAFQILQALRDDLRNTQGLSTTDQLQTISARLTEIDRVRTNFLSYLGQQSATQQNLEGWKERLNTIQIETKKQLSDLEDVDVTEVVIRLQSQQNLMQLALAATARMWDQSLLDFIR